MRFFLAFEELHRHPLVRWSMAPRCVMSSRGRAHAHERLSHVPTAAVKVVGEMVTGDRCSRGVGELEGLSILVTGGGTGIGAGIALRLALEGGWVTICGRTEGYIAVYRGGDQRRAGREAVRWSWPT